MALATSSSDGSNNEHQDIDNESDHNVDCLYYINKNKQIVEGEHKEQCPTFPTSCPKSCKMDSVPHENLNEHKEMYSYDHEEVVYPNGNGISVQGHTVTNHIEEDCNVSCKRCHITGKYQDIQDSHKEQCQRFPMACLNKCEIDSVPRDDVEEHIINSPMELIQCEYHVVGCEERMAHKDKKKHKGSNNLCKQLEQMYTKYTTQLNPISVKLDSVQAGLDATQETAKTIQERIDVELSSSANEISTVKENFNDFQSQVQETTTGINQRITVVETETKDKVSDCIQRLEESEGTLKQELVTIQQKLIDTNKKLSAAQEGAEKAKEQSEKIIEILTQRLANTEEDLEITKQQLTTSCQNLVNVEKDHATLAANTDKALSKLEAAFQTKVTEIEYAAQKKIVELEHKLQQKIHQTELQFYWHRTMSLTADKLSSGDQVVPVIVKMSEYTKKKNHKMTWYSDSFYTHKKGYKMCLGAYAAGLCGGRSSDLSVKLYIMKGPYDDQLTWPLKGHCEIKLLNQISNSDHYVSHDGKYWDYGHKRVTIASWEISNYYMWLSERFISTEDLYSMTITCQYLKDDCLYFQVQYVMD